MPTTTPTGFSDQESQPSVETIHLREKVAMLEAKVQVLEARIKELEALLPPPPDAAAAAFNHIRKHRR